MRSLPIGNCANRFEDFLIRSLRRDFCITLNLLHELLLLADKSLSMILNQRMLTTWLSVQPVSSHWVEP